MRIAIFSETFMPRVNGVVTTLRHLLDHLERRGHESIVFVPDDEAPSRYAASTVIPLPCPTWRVAEPEDEPPVRPLPASLPADTWEAGRHSRSSMS